MGIIPVIPGGASGGITNLLTGKVAYVDAATGSDAAATAATYDRAKPWQTITAALAAVASGDVVAVFPGSYAESLTVPAGVVLESTAEAGQVFITGALATGARITLSAGSIARTISVTTPTDAVAAIECPDTISAEIQGIDLMGGGSSGYGIRKTGSGALLFARVRLMSGSIGSVVRYDGVGGALVGEQLTCINSGTAGIIVDAAGVGLVKLRTIAAALPLAYSEGIRCAAGSIVKFGASSLIDADVGLRFTGDGVDFDSARVALDSATWDLLVDPAVTTVTRFVLTGARFSYALVSMPDGIASDGAVYLEAADAQDGEPGKLIAGKLGVGTFRSGRRSEFGEGGAHTINMAVLANTSLAAGAWTDNTADAQSSSGSTFSAFSSVSVDATFYVGGSLPFPAFVDDVQTIINLGAGSLVWEYWNGAWTAINIMVSSVPGLTSSAQVWSATAEMENVRICAPDDWLSTTLNALDRYWIRARIVGGITTSPLIEAVALLTNHSRINKHGHLEFFGKAEPVSALPGLSVSTLVPVAGSVPQNQSLNFSAGINLDVSANKFGGSVLDSAGGLFIAQHGLDTSCPLTVAFRWSVDGVATGDVEWVVRISSASVGGTLSGGLSELSLAQIATIAAPSDHVIQPEQLFVFDLPDVLEGDQLAIVVERDATGGNPSDTLATAVYISDIHADGFHWV